MVYKCVVVGLLLMLLLFCDAALCQQEPIIDTVDQPMVVQTDTAITLQKHSPTKATLYSMALPGLGQAYNKKYWKIPIVYAGFGVLYYFIRANDNEYQKFKEAYYHSVQNEDGTEPPVNEYEANYDTEFLLSAKNYYRRNRDLSYILSGLWYLINIADAAVDAHLYTWEVDEDLSLRLEPDIIAPVGLGYGSAGGGVKLTLSF